MLSPFALIACRDCAARAYVGAPSSSALANIEECTIERLPIEIAVANFVIDFAKPLREPAQRET
jgi:hypothetical protein